MCPRAKETHYRMKKLNKTDEQAAFQVHAGYFEDFEHRLTQRIHDKNDASLPVKKSNLFKPWMTMAAGFALIALIYTLVPEKLTQKQTQEKTSELFLLEQQSELLNEYELIDWLTTMSSEEIDLYPDSLLFQDLNEEDLLYLSYID